MDGDSNLGGMRNELKNKSKANKREEKKSRCRPNFLLPPCYWTGCPSGKRKLANPGCVDISLA